MNNQHQKTVYICLISFHIGGTEKRIAEIWNFLQKYGWKNVHLVISRTLYTLLCKLPYLENLHPNNSSLIILECPTLFSFVKSLLSLAYKAKRGSVFHYPLHGLQMIHKLLGHEIIISHNANNFFCEYTGGIKRKLLFLFRASNASKIDVLNPANLEKFKKIKLTKNKVSLNPGSFVNLDHYISHPDKKNWITFCGRFAKGDPKNVLKFLEAIPYIAHKLKQEKLLDIKFFILGHGPLETQLKTKLAGPCYNDIDITLRFENSPAEVMKYSKVFLSLQKSSNYPSKSLLEALACGNLPVVTDVGETRLIADESFSKFISKNLDPNELAQAILDILLMQKEEFMRRTQYARDFLENKFNIQEHEKYYLELYGLRRNAYETY